MLRNTGNSKDMCLFVKQARANLGQHEHLEIPLCTLDDTGRFVGPMADLIEETLDITLSRSSAVSLTGLAFGAKSEGVYAMADECDDRVQIFLYRTNMSPEQITVLEQKIDCAGRRRRMVTDEEPGKQEDETYVVKEEMSIAGTDAAAASPLKMVPLGDAWRSTTDAKSMVALFLVHELRYHDRMPRYRAPRISGGSGQRVAVGEPLEKKTALFSKIASLDPSSVGINLKAKVVMKMDQIEEATRRDGRRTKYAFLVVGDETGVVTLKAVNDQLATCELFEVGSNIVVRNAKIDMGDGHMRLVVDRWGKITSDMEGEDLSEFDFAVKEDHDMSSTEYELVVMHEDEQMKREDGVNGRKGRRTPMRGGGAARLSRRGRGGKGAGGGGGGGGVFYDGQTTESAAEATAAHAVTSGGI
eukprot:GHVS01026120.1.p1 GENE.GHVS01026120.1~~GHVS01026120.1.p1  ORF type:complete len:415 (+),score=80.68 GHVS01026120.1:530-1774(+)